VQTLPSNSTAITVYEAVGDDTYQVKDNEAVLFKAGHIKGVLPANQTCGCPAPPPRAAQIEVARATPPPTPAPTPPTKPDAKAESKPLPVAPSPDEHITMEAPFIFHGDDPYPDLTANVATLKIENNQMIQLDPVVLPPKAKQPKPGSNQGTTASTPPEKKRSFFASIGSFFASIFK
jgi:hypothetical protein